MPPIHPPSITRVLIRATNWLGDAVMSLPALRSVREVFPEAEIAVAARPGLAGFYARERCVDRVIEYPAPRSLAGRLAFFRSLRRQRFDCAVLFQNAFDAALLAFEADIPIRIGYRRDGRGLLLTHAIAVPEPGDIPRHQRFYYLELLRRAGLIDRFPECEAIRLDRLDEARASGLARIRSLGFERALSVSPGAAYGDAKRWLPERFADASSVLARESSAAVLVLGSLPERALCESVARLIAPSGVPVKNLAGETSLTEYIELAAASLLCLSNDSGSMHVASAVGVPSITVFGATDDAATGPTGPLACVVRAHAECSPCLLRTCPIDHRCMTRVETARVIQAAHTLWKEPASPAWTLEARS